MTPQDWAVLRLQRTLCKTFGPKEGVGGSNIIYGICVCPMILSVFLCELLLLHCSHSPVSVSSALAPVCCDCPSQTKLSFLVAQGMLQTRTEPDEAEGECSKGTPQIG